MTPFIEGASTGQRSIGTINARAMPRKPTSTICPCALARMEHSAPPALAMGVDQFIDLGLDTGSFECGDGGEIGPRFQARYHARY